ncbi:MAG: hypothetical protein Q7R65_01730 [bacterium]|nr:hypothetical protein [bacterium]
MNWKHWPYWLRGGVVGAVFVLLSSILSFSCLYLFTSPGSWGLGCVPFEIPWIPFWFIPNFTSLPLISYEVIVGGSWFLLGSLVGAFVGFIKSKKSTQ